MEDTEQIRFSSDVKAALEAEQLPEESYSDTIERLIEERVARRREAIRKGAGLWADSDAVKGAADIRDQMNDELGPDR